jgi:hypothetical protein
MFTRTLIPFLVGLLALGVASCAPVALPEGETVPLPAETLPVQPLRTEPTPVSSMPGAVPEGRLRRRIEEAVKNVRQRDLLTTNSFWTVFHGLLGLGPDTELLNPETRQRMRALDYICAGGEVRGLRFLPTAHGLDVQTGPFMVGQGHQDQFVAEMAQWGMPAERKFLVGGREYTFLDFVRHSQARARVSANQELSWAIIVVGQYLGTNVSWTNEHGEKLHFDELIRYEVEAPIESAACGGTHRLFGLSWAYHLHLRNGGKTEGVWKQVAARTAEYRDRARQYQNGDGTFSTSFFRERGNAPDKQLRVNTTGHTLEWLALALTDEELKAPWVEAAANALALTILDLQGSPVEGGSVYHAAHGLLIYHARVYGRTAQVPSSLLVPLPPGWGAPRGR